MDCSIANRPAMQVSLIAGQSIDSAGRRHIQRKDSEDFYDFRPPYLTAFDIFENRDMFDECLEEQLKGIFNNDFNSSESSTRGPEQSTIDAPVEAVPDNFNPYDELDQDFDYPLYYASQDGLRPAPQAPTVPIPRSPVSMMPHPHHAQRFGPHTFTSTESESYALLEQQRLRHGLLKDHPTSMPYIFPTAYQFTRPVLTKAPPMIPHRQPTPQLHIPPVLTGPGPVASNAQPVPQLFTAPYRGLAPQHLKGRFRQLTEAKIFEDLPPELEVMIFKYALKADQPFRVAYNGQIDSRTTKMQNLLFVSHATEKKYPGLLYRQNVFLCEHANSVGKLLCQPIEVTTQILHIDLAVGVISQVRFNELHKLRGLRTIRIIGVKGYRTGYDPAITHNASTAQRLQQIELAVQTTLNSPAVRSSKGTARFVASQRVVRELMKKRNVKFTFAAQYKVYMYPLLQWNHYETVFEVTLVGGEWGYGLQMRVDKLIRTD